MRNKDIKDMVIGFADESALQLHQNNARFWSLSHTPRVVNTTQGSQKFFGFYALQGESLIEKMKHCKEEDFQKSLLAIKAQNHDKEVIIFWDNAKVHKKVEQWAWKHGIYIINIPIYSPNLNPIERLWKSCKKYVNQQEMPKTLEQVAKNFETAFHLFKVQKNYAKDWLNQMKEIFSWKNHTEDISNTFS